MRLIDVDALRNAFQNVIDEASPPYDNEIGAIRCGVRLARNIAEDEPVIDAVPVVRCKDCKKYIPCQKLPIGTSKWCDLFDRATCEMNYCAWGERREGE